MDFLTAPSRDCIAAISEEPCFFAGAEAAALEDDAAGRKAALLIFFSALSAFSFFFSTLARVSASHGALTFPRDSGGRLVHCAEPPSPAISAMERLLSTELSYCSMS